MMFFPSIPFLPYTKVTLYLIKNQIAHKVMSQLSGVAGTLPTKNPKSYYCAVLLLYILFSKASIDTFINIVPFHLSIFWISVFLVYTSLCICLKFKETISLPLFCLHKNDSLNHRDTFERQLLCISTSECVSGKDYPSNKGVLIYSNPVIQVPLYLG